MLVYSSVPGKVSHLGMSPAWEGLLIRTPRTRISMETLGIFMGISPGRALSQNDIDLLQTRSHILPAVICISKLRLASRQSIVVV